MFALRFLSLESKVLSPFASPSAFGFAARGIWATIFAIRYARSQDAHARRAKTFLKWRDNRKRKAQARKRTKDGQENNAEGP